MSLTRNVSGVIALAVAMTFVSPALADGDATNGEKIFRKCSACHSLEEGKKKVGPSLHGVFGRQAGSLEGFKFSKAMTAYGESGVVWDEETLFVYLEAPRKIVKGTRMAFGGLKKEQDRSDLISYLADATQ